MGVMLLPKRVGTRGFEPPTSSSRTRRATRRRYVPTGANIIPAGYLLSARKHSSTRPVGRLSARRLFSLSRARALADWLTSGGRKPERADMVLNGYECFVSAGVQFKGAGYG